jgi:hypothetical protein
MGALAVKASFSALALLVSEVVMTRPLISAGRVNTQSSAPTERTSMLGRGQGIYFINILYACFKLRLVESLTDYRRQTYSDSNLPFLLAVEKDTVL